MTVVSFRFIQHHRVQTVPFLLLMMAMADTHLTFPVCLLRGQSPLHSLGQYGKENAAAIFDLFLECMPEYPLDKPDAEGNTGTW